MKHSHLSEDFPKIAGCLGDMSSLAGTRWLMTGCTGVVGSFLLSFLDWLNEHRLGRSMRFVVLHRSDVSQSHPAVGHLAGRNRIDFRRVDLSGEFRLPGEEDFEYVFHGASKAAPKAYLADPVGTINTNVRATQILLDRFRSARALRGFLFVSSGEVYGSPGPGDIPTPEEYRGVTDHLAPRSCYVEAKRFGEVLCRNYFSACGMPVKVVRPVHLFGPGFSPDDGRVWADFIARACSGHDLEILGDGTARRGFCYVADGVSQILAVLTRGAAGEVYNAGTESHISVRELAETVAAQAATGSSVVIRNRLPDHLKGSPQVSCPSVRKVRALGPLLETDLAEGIARTIAWFRGVSGR